jgi:hypothetical protein
MGPSGVSQAAVGRKRRNFREGFERTPELPSREIRQDFARTEMHRAGGAFVRLSD